MDIQWDPDPDPIQYDPTDPTITIIAQHQIIFLLLCVSSIFSFSSLDFFICSMYSTKKRDKKKSLRLMTTTPLVWQTTTTPTPILTPTQSEIQTPQYTHSSNSSLRILLILSIRIQPIIPLHLLTRLYLRSYPLFKLPSPYGSPFTIPNSNTNCFLFSLSHKCSQ